MTKLDVLAIDDNDAENVMIAEILHLSGSFHVDLGDSLASLWHHLADKTYDVILLDYQLPDGTGIEALKEITSRGIDTPVIMITGNGDERVAVQAIQRGAMDYLVKGDSELFTLPALIQKVVRLRQIRKAVEKAEEQIRYQALLLNNVRDAVVVWDIEGKITYWNPAAEAIYGRRADECLGQDVAEGYLAAFSPAIQVPPREATGGHEVERSYRKAEDSTIWVSSRVSTLRDFGADGRIIGYMDVSRDITERKQMEAQIRSAQSHLIQSARMAAIGELASGVAHQINNPLTIIIAEIQLMRQELPPEHPLLESVEAIEQAGWRTQGVVQQLAEFSSPASDTLESLSLNQTIQRALILVGAHFLAAGIALEPQFEANLPDVRGNARQLEDLWMNLLLLARDADRANQPDRIIVRSERGDSSIIAEIINPVHIIPEDRLETIFEPDFIGPTPGLGSGLELSICREIVRQHRGNISAESDSQNGTIFRVTLPIEVSV